MLYIFNVNSLRFCQSGRKTPKDYEDQSLLPNVHDFLKELKKNNNIIVGISDYPETSFNGNELLAWTIDADLNRMTGNVFNDIHINFYDQQGPKKARFQDKRKPLTTLLDEFIADFGLTSNKKEVVYIGNDDDDVTMARNCGVEFYWSYSFFKWDVKILQRDGHRYYWTHDSLKKLNVDQNNVYLEMVNNEGTCIGKRIFPKDCTIKLASGPKYIIGG